MQIMKRAKSGGEMIPFNADEKSVKEEVDRRTAKAGFTTRYGECPYRTKIQNRGYGDKPLNVWPRDENGNLIGD